MKKIIVFIVALFSINSLIAQECICQKNDYINDINPYSFYDLGKGNKIALCGEANEDDTFSEFVLTDCNSKTNFNFWGAMKRCSVEQEIDTLIIKEFAFLPIDKDEYQIVVWYVYKYWFNDDKQIQQKTFLSPNFPKYNQKQIDDIIKRYQNSGKIINDNCIILANKLFISAISGSQEARKYFLEFPIKFKGLDGAFLEDYKELDAMLGIWENNQKANKFKD